MSGFRAIAGTQSIETASRLAVKNGRSPVVQAVDDQILDEHLAGEQADLQRADAQRPLDVLRPFGFRALRCTAGPRSTVTDDDNGGREERDDQRQAEADVAEQAWLAQALEELH